MKNKLLTISKIGLLAFTILVSQACQEDYEMVDPPMVTDYDDDLDEEVILQKGLESYFVTQFGEGDMDGTSWDQAMDVVGFRKLLSGSIDLSKSTIYMSQGKYVMSETGGLGVIIRKDIKAIKGGYSLLSEGTDLTNRRIDTYKTVISGDVNGNNQADSGDCGLLLVKGGIIGIEGVTFQYGYLSNNDGFSQKLYEVSQSGEMSAKNNDPLYWYTTTEEETLFAWYPSSETLLTEWTVATDQTNEESYKNSDFLYAYEKMKFRSERKLKFHHGTVKLIINVKGDGDTVSEEDLKDMVFTVSAITKGTMTEGKLQPAAGVEAIVMKPYKLEDAREGYIYSFQLLMVPQDMSGKSFFKVTLKDGRNFGHTPGNGEGLLEGGHQYTYNVGVGKPGLKVTIEKDSVSWDGDDEEVEGTDKE